MSDQKSDIELFEDGLREKHGEVFKAEFHDAGDAKVAVYYLRPKKNQYDRFTSDIMDKNRMSNGVRTLARDVIIHPKGDALEALLERIPGILIKVGGEAGNIGSGDAAELGKRL